MKNQQIKDAFSEGRLLLLAVCVLFSTAPAGRTVFVSHQVSVGTHVLDQMGFQDETP